MNNSSVRLSPIDAWLYTWNKATLHNTGTLNKLFGSLKAFSVAIYHGGNYLVDKAEANKVYDSYQKSTFGKANTKFKELCQRRSLKVATQISHQLSIEIPSEKPVQECSAKEFIELMTEGSFSDDIHYVVTGHLIYPKSYKPNTQAIRLPAYLTVNGRVSFDEQSELKDIPNIFIVNGDLNLRGCKSLVDLSSKKLKVMGDVLFNHCDNMVSAPGELHVEGEAKFSFCKNLNLFSNRFLIFSLTFLRCDSLQELPHDLTVLNELYVQFCSSLKSLPSHLSVGNHLFSDMKVPTEAKIGGVIYSF